MKLEEQVKQSVDIVRSQGYRINYGVWIAPTTKECCILGACLLADNVDVYCGKDWPDLASEHLGMATDEVAALTAGFDGNQFEPHTGMERLYYAMGSQFRKEYIDGV